MSMSASPSFIFSQNSRHFSPADVSVMRHAFNEMCRDRPLVTASDGQRLNLAKAVVATYKEHLSEAELIDAALQLLDEHQQPA